MSQIDSLSIEITADAQKAVSSLNRLSQSLNTIASSLASVNTSGFGGLTNGINQLTSAMEQYANSSVKTADFTRLASQLNRVASVDTAGLHQLASGINSLGNVTNSLSQLSGVNQSVVDFAKALGKLGGVSIERAVVNLPQLGTALRDVINTLSRTPQVSQNVLSLVQSLAQLTSGLNGVKTVSNNASTGLNLFSNTASRTSKASKGLASAIGKVYATYWLLFRAFSVFGKAINYASSLTEIQNVVEHTFGQSTEKINEFAKASKDALGMSELTYKEIASRYQAMGGAMDISNNSLKRTSEYLSKVTNGYVEADSKASGMSVTLTKLAGDMASFYDKDQKDVAEDLEAIYTGMTRPLRKYGLDLTQATLQEYANKKGIDAKVSSMSQAEKTMLRYQYVLENTTNAQGDFLRTADTWANQVKIMKQNFISLGTTLGQVFINAFKPFIKTLNNILVAVNNFAVKVANALGSIFGWTIETNDVGLLSETEEDAGGLADNLGKADKNAKKLKNTIMGYDELNVMQKQDDSDSDSGSGLEDSLLGGLDVKSKESKPIVKYFESDIKDLYGLGRKIADTLQRMMEGINWDSIYEKARNFGKGLADFLNGLFKPEMFYQLGRTIAGCLNTALNFLDSFAENFDFEQFGQAISSAVNGFFENFDFKLLAQTINKWVNGIYKTITTIINDIKWDKVWDGVKTFLAELDVSTISIIIGGIVLKYASKILTASLLKSLIIKKLGTLSMGTLGMTLPELALSIALVTVVFIGGLQVGKEIGKYLADETTKSFYENFHWLGEGGFFDEITKDADVTIQALKDMFSYENIFGELMNGNYSAGATLIFGKIFKSGTTGWETPFEDVIGKLNTLRTTFTSINDLLNNSGENSFSKYFGSASKYTQSATIEMESYYGSANETSIKLESLSQDTEVSKGKFQSWYESVSSHFNSSKWQGLLNNVKTAFETKWNEISSWWKSTTLVKWFNDDVKPWFTVAKWTTEWNNIVTTFKTKWNEISTWWKSSALVRWYEDSVKPWFTVAKWETLWNTVKSVFESKWNEIVEWWKTSGLYKWYEEHVKPWFDRDKWNFGGVKEGLVSAFEGAFDGVKTVFNRFIDWINDKLEFSWDDQYILGNKVLDGGSISLGHLPKFATGGFPEDGLFMANHNELVGQFSNGRTAVANNQQITEGIKQAVVEGMMNVVMATSGSNKESGDINLYLDGKVIAQTTYNNLKTMGRQGLIPRFI